MKKILAILLIFVMIFSLTACGDSKAKEIYDEIEGEYSDSIAQRAYMEVTENGNKGVIIKIWWGSSAAEKDFWSMTAKYDSKDGLLKYDDCKHEIITFSDEEGAEETTELVADKLSGYFEIDLKNETLTWSGASEESCKDTVFVDFD